MGTVLAALFFALAAYIGVALAGTITLNERLDGSPAPSEPPVPIIVGGAAIIGALIAMQYVDSERLLLSAIVVCALAAIWCTDVRHGIVPDVFTLIPLALIFIVAVLRREPGPFIWAAIPFAAFAATAAISKGRGMGWGDVKLAALGGAVLGGEIALLAFCVGCLAAVAYSYVRGSRAVPIAFAPYLASAIAVAMPIAVSR